MGVSVCTIVKEDTFYLKMMVRSVITAVEEIIIIDSSSTSKNLHMLDNILTKKQRAKIKYIEYMFGDNLGEGRQKAIDNATQDYILWLDADEVLHENELPRIKQLEEQCKKDKIDAVHDLLLQQSLS